MYVDVHAAHSPLRRSEQADILQDIWWLLYCEQDFGLCAEWHFFMSYGKGPADRIGGTVKKLAAEASLQTVYNKE
jgi:hypothetical protein